MVKLSLNPTEEQVAEYSKDKQKNSVREKEALKALKDAAIYIYRWA